MNSSTEKPQLAIMLRSDEGSLVIEALAECPFKVVYDLIGRLNQQANRQGHASPDGTAQGDPVEYLISASDMKLIVSALGNLPFNRVHLLLANLQAQLSARAA